MDSPFKYAIKSFAINLLAGLVIFAPLLLLRGDAGGNWLFVLLVVVPLSLIVQMVVGIVYVAGGTTEKTRNIGKGMLMTVGFFFLIGLSVCGGMWAGL